MTCSVLSCNNTITTCNLSNDGISFYKFPKDPEIREIWIKRTGRQNWIPVMRSRICSEHFRKEDIKVTKVKRLCKESVPSLNINIFCSGIKSEKEDADDELNTSPDTNGDMSTVEHLETIISENRVRINRLHCKFYSSMKKNRQLKELIQDFDTTNSEIIDKIIALEDAKETMQEFTKKKLTY